MKRPRYNALGCAPITYSLDEATRAYVAHVAAARFEGNRSKAVRYLIAKGGEKLEAEGVLS
jgi:hypothetical protein